MAISKGVSKHWTPAQRESILRAYRRSELTQKAFAGEAGIGLSTLQKWLRASGAAPASPVEFVAVPNVLAHSPAASVYRLRWPHGVVLELSPGFRPEEVAALLPILEAR